MAWQFTPYTLPVFVTTVVGLGVATFAMYHAGQRGGRWVALFMVGASLWAFTEGMNLARADLAGKLFWTKLGSVASGVVALAWFALVLEYTGNGRWLRPRTLGVLALEPLAVLGVAVTRPGWLRASADLLEMGSFVVLQETLGPAMFLHIIYSYGLILVGAVLLVRVILSTEGLYRTQSTALLGAIFLPLVGNVAYNFGLAPPVLDYTALAFLLSGVLITATILRRKLLEIVPIAREIARDEIFENLDDRVFVVDRYDRLVDCNPAATTLLERPKEAVIGTPMAEVLPPVAEVLEAADDSVQAELTMDAGNASRHYDVRISPLSRAGGLVEGTLVSLRDVSEKRQQRQRLEVLNRLLRHNLRNDMNVIAGNAQLLGDELSDPDLVDRLDRIETTATEITTRSDKVGRVARLLEEQQIRTVDLSDVVVEEVATVRTRYGEAEITVDVPAGIRVEVGPSIAVAIEELLTNAIEHNESPAHVHVSAHEDGGFAVLAICDDGPGIAPAELEVLEKGTETALEHGSGVGLWVVNWVVQQFGGRLEFDTAGEGCTAEIHLPTADVDAAVPAAADTPATSR